MCLSVDLEKKSVVTMLLMIDVWTSRNFYCFFEKNNVTCMRGWIVFANSWKRHNVSSPCVQRPHTSSNNGSMRMANGTLDPAVVSPTNLDTLMHSSFPSETL